MANSNDISMSTPSKGAFQSIFYVNDIHGQLPRMEQLMTASKQFDTFVKENKSDSLKLSGGDNFIGCDESVNNAAAAFLNTAGIEATAVGNHEFDMSASVLSKVADNLKNTKLVVSNSVMPAKSPLSKNLVTSFVKTDKSGQKYGIIGMQSPEIKNALRDHGLMEGLSIAGEREKYRLLQKAVDNLEKQGVNKIIAVSHSGFEEDKKTARNVSGIDVIIGGHTHNLIKDIKPGHNLQYSPKGEPVVITQAGKDGAQFGILNVTYDDKGIITSAQNNVLKTEDYGKDLEAVALNNSYVGNANVLANITETHKPPKKFNASEYGCADKMCDIIKDETGADIVLVNSGNFRGSIKKGSFTQRDLNCFMPFDNKMFNVEINEKDLVEALKHGATTVANPDLKPSILQVSGLKYSVNKDGELTAASFVDKKGEEHKIDVNNPDEKKTYVAAYDEYLLGGGDGFKSLKKDEDKILKKFECDKSKIVSEYFKKNGVKDLSLEKDNRISIDDSDDDDDDD